MGKRVGLLAGLLVLALGSGAMAQEPSPEATPLYAADDLTTVLPSEIGGIQMSVEPWPGPYTLATADDRQRQEWDEVLTGLDKEPTDLSGALARPVYSPDQGYVIVAFRVDGISADVLMDRYLRVHAAVAGRPIPDDWYLPSQAVEGRTIYPTQDSPRLIAFSYPVGEVLFMVLGTGDVSAGEVLAELP